MEKPHKILIVDDDRENLEMILELLSGSKEELIYAPNGRIAVNLATEELPDLIIMDWEMPELSGIGAIRELQKNPSTRQIPVIITTGIMLEAADMETALDSGAIDFLRKPFNPVELKARIRATLRLKEQHETITVLLENEKRRIEESLERKKRELASAALIEHEKNSILEKLIAELNQLIRDETASQSQLLSLRRQLKSQMNVGRSWDSFRLHFEQVHPDFFQRLETLLGALSLNEKRICAFIKIGLTNKEIALLTNVEASSVRKSLNRFKTKIGLLPEQNLREYIDQI